MTKEELERFLTPFMGDIYIYLEYSGRRLFLDADSLKYVPATESHNAHVTFSLGDMEREQMKAGAYND